MIEQTRSYGISFFLHLSIVALIIQAAPTIHSLSKPLLIDFTLMESLPARQEPHVQKQQAKSVPQPPVQRPIASPPPKAKPKMVKPKPQTKIAAHKKKIKIVPQPALVPEPIKEPEQIVEEEPIVEEIAVDQPIALEQEEEISPEPTPPGPSFAQEATEDPNPQQYKQVATSALPAAGPGPVSPLPSQPQVTQVERYTMAHFKNIRNTIQNQLNYPIIARKRGWQGTVIIEFQVCPDGGITDIIIVESSGHKALDKNAVATIKAASPFPVPPVPARLKIPVVYRLS